MNETQWDAILNNFKDSESLVKSDDVGSRREPQEPENQKNETKGVKPMSARAHG